MQMDSDDILHDALRATSLSLYPPYQTQRVIPTLGGREEGLISNLISFSLLPRGAAEEGSAGFLTAQVRCLSYTEKVRSTDALLVSFHDLGHISFDCNLIFVSYRKSSINS